MDTNVLYYGDNLSVLRNIPDNAIDLIYLDPPFNSKATYNVLYKEPTGEPSKAQLTAFEDTWHWGDESRYAFQQIMESKVAPVQVQQLMDVLPSFVGNKTDMRAYLVMMTVRLIELRRVLKETGSIYLHCDSTASHYLKIVMDMIFGADNFCNEIIWQKIRASKAQTIGFGKVHDVIFYYTKTSDVAFYPERVIHSDKYLKSHYRYTEPKTNRTYRLDNFTQTGQGIARKFGNKIIEPPHGKHWIWSQERIDDGMQRGLIIVPEKGMPSVKRYLDEVRGNFVEDIWVDIPPINSMAKERLPYPTQKPLALLERIIKASSNEGDIVLDPFCGCGTAVVAAHKFNRKWIGIDVTYLAISTMKYRLEQSFPNITIKVVGEPTVLSEAKVLAEQDKYQFQWWAVSLIKGQPYGNKKKGADTGIDGYLWFATGIDKYDKAIISVKGGSATVKDIRDLDGVVDREKTPIGIFITMHEPTRKMVEEAAEHGYYKSPFETMHRRIQILTVRELMDGKKPDVPLTVSPIQAMKQDIRNKQTEQLL